MDPQVEKELEATINAANDASDKVRTQHFAFVSFLVYFSLIIGSTTDKQLLLISPVNLPLLNVELPLREFYVIAPWILVFLHFHLLIQFYLLSQKLHLFKSDLSKISNADELKAWSNRLSAFAFNHLIINRQHKPSMRIVLAAIILITVIVLPLVLLLWAQARFIPYQSEAITWSHRVVVLADIFVLWLMWPRIITPMGSLSKVWQLRQLYCLMQIDKPRLWTIFFRWRRRYQRYTSRHWVPVNSLLLLVITLSLFVVVIPNGWMEMRLSQIVPESWLITDESRSFVDISYKKITEKFNLEEGVANNRYFALTHWFFNFPGQPFRQNLFIRNEILVNGAESAEVKNLLRSRDDSVHKQGLQKIEGLSLQERNLRYADFLGSILVKVDLGRADKQQSASDEARPRGADLRGANLINAQLKGADLSDAILQGADLTTAQLQGANLINAQLKGADLSDAILQGADLTTAQLQGAYLGYAQLQGAYLSDAQLQGADLINAQLKGADLSGAQLQGAYLSYAQLQGADLSKANLQRAIIHKSEFGILSPESVKNLIDKEKEFESSVWYKHYVNRLKKAEGRMASGVNDKDAVRCQKDDLNKCDLTQTVKVWIDVSCKSIYIAKGIISAYRSDFLIREKKYHTQYVEGIRANECQLNSEEKAEIINFLTKSG